MVATWFISGQPRQTRFWILISLIALLGFMAEIIGVNKGWLFGEYQYSSLLGPKLLNTPLLIGLLWSYVAWSMYVISRNISSIQLRLIASGAGGVLFDVVLEHFAERTLLWSWSNGHPSTYNYVCWFVLTVIFVLILELSKLKPRQKLFAFKTICLELIFCLAVILK